MVIDIECLVARECVHVGTRNDVEMCMLVPTLAATGVQNILLRVHGCDARAQDKADALQALVVGAGGVEALMADPGKRRELVAAMARMDASQALNVNMVRHMWRARAGHAHIRILSWMPSLPRT